MNKMVYQKPTMKVVQLHQRTHLLSGSGNGNGVQSLSGTFTKYGGGANVEARSRDFGDWDDWDEE